MKEFTQGMSAASEAPNGELRVGDKLYGVDPAEGRGGLRMVEFTIIDMSGDCPQARVTDPSPSEPEIQYVRLPNSRLGRTKLSACYKFLAWFGDIVDQLKAFAREDYVDRGEEAKMATVAQWAEEFRKGESDGG